MVKVKF